MTKDVGLACDKRDKAEQKISSFFGMYLRSSVDQFTGRMCDYVFACFVKKIYWKHSLFSNAHIVPADRNTANDSNNAERLHLSTII